MTEQPPETADVVTMDKIVALCKRRGFIFPSSEIYGGVGSTYDFGHYGVLLKGNVKTEWWRAMLQERDDIVALDSAILQHPRVWEASGHLAGFTDPLVDCKTCGQRFRADHLAELPCGRKPSKHPGETDECDLTEARDFNLMFETTIGPVKESGSVAYLRPETAQGIFINFKNVLRFSRKKPPFGIAQIGKSFRNEITPGNFIFRTREFEQMEMEFFVPPAEAQKWFEHWLSERERWYTDARPAPRPPAAACARRRRALPLLLGHKRRRVPVPDRLVGARGDRQPRRLRPQTSTPSSRARSSSTSTSSTKERYVPHVIEPAAGADRATLAFLVDAYDEEVVRAPTRRTQRAARRKRTVLRLHPRLAPVKVAVMPLVKKDGQPGDGARDLRGSARAHAGRVRRGRLDRQALPPPGRDRHAVGRDGRPPVDRGRHGDAARPRLARPGADEDR